MRLEANNDHSVIDNHLSDQKLGKIQVQIVVEREICDEEAHKA